MRGACKFVEFLPFCHEDVSDRIFFDFKDFSRTLIRRKVRDNFCSFGQVEVLLTWGCGLIWHSIVNEKPSQEHLGPVVQVLVSK